MTKKESDDLQPMATGTPAITRDITGETHVHAADETPAGTRVYTVREGDTLGTIAKRFYGNEKEFSRIVEANRDRLGDQDEPIIGSALRIPPAR
jgi:nucleoid-associated protein YgaU